ncbi:non-ribosomal peptide synthetase [Streptomyces sp. SID5468]|nr:non-ribosomal peptide synthetase [Streptomyces sp. SID5468]
MSFAQRRLWFAFQLEGPSPTYNCPLYIRFSGALDTGALVAAVGDVVERHEALRTRFAEIDGEPCQVVLSGDEARPAVESVTLDGEPALAEALRERGRYAFDLAGEVPLKVTLYQVAPEEYVLLLLLHHIAADGGSLAPLARDLSEAYGARVGGTAPAWEPLPVQYADYALWQRDVLGAEDDPDSLAAEQLAYWAKQLDGVPELLELPLDKPRPAVASHRGATVRYTVDADLHAAVVELARRTDTTVFMVVQAALAVLLSRLGAGTDIPLGTAVAGRTDEALEDLVGFFVNTLVLRTDVSGDPTFRELLARVRETDLAAYAHQDVPFEQVVEAVNPGRSLSHAPLFQVILTLQSNAGGKFTVPGVDARFGEVDTGVAKVDLTFYLEERAHPDGTPAGLVGEIQYAVDLFEGSSAGVLAERLVRVLGGLVSAPDVPVSGVGVLSSSEWDELVVGRNATAREVVPASVAGLFEGWVSRSPGAVALVFEGEELSYGEVDGRANRLARLLIACGVGRESLVALAVPRSVEMVVAALAVHKAGGAYLPVDPEYPAERIAYMLDDAKPVCVVTTSGVSLPPVECARVVLDDEAVTAELAGLSDAVVTDAERGGPLDVRHPAYVIYTSGSTGRPKGVVVTHRGVASLALAQADRLEVAPGARVLQFASLSFDAAAWELVMALANGAALVVAPASRLVAGEPLARLVAEQGVTHVTLPPAVLGVLPDGALPEGVTLVVAGEACAPELVGRWSRGRRMVNAYGPTEATVCATMSAPLSGAVVPPMGGPIANARVYVLDEGLRPVPAGVPGELYLSGAGLARGYLGRPALTAERFVADPFGEPGGRLYRTGDLVRWRADGELEFLGRTDHQVKVRGFRIELGEIESALAGHASVAEALVVVREDGPGGRQLVGYVTPADGCAPDVAELRQHVAASLPDYMVPATVVVLDRWPLTPNGKVDRKRLPVPEFATEGGRAPRTEREETLAAVFADVLGRESVTIDDDFFDLGGHSLLATRLISRLRGELGVELPVRAIFEAPTVAGLAEAVDRAASARPALLPMARPDRLPLSYAQRRLWAAFRLEGPSPTYNIPLALRLTGPLDTDALTAAVRDVVERHEALRTRFAEADGEPYQVVLPADAVPAVAVVPVSGEDALRTALTEAADHRFDLTAEVPLRATLYRITPGEHVLLLLMHHIAADGWSMGPLARDLSEAYGARLAGTAPAWAPLPVGYADYALWQRDVLGAEDDPDSLAARQLAYWAERLSGAPELLELPLDKPRPAVASHRGASVELAVDAALHEALVSLAQETGTTLFMVLHAAVAVLLSRLGAGTDVPVSTVLAGRTDEALDDLVGFFVNTLVLRTDVSGDPTFRELLGRVRETDLAAFAHQDVPFDRVLEAAHVTRALSHTPFFQVSLNLQNNADSALTMRDLTVVPEPVALDAAKADLSFGIRERFTTDGRPAGLTGSLEYAVDLFEGSSAGVLARRLVRVLGGLVSAPDVPVSGVGVLSSSEWDELVVGRNATAREVVPASVAGLFEGWVSRSPGAVALVFEGEELSYGEVDGRANRLARLLIACGVGRESLVALAVPRSVEMVVAALAVHKAGGAYLPVDPEYPAERIAYMLDDAKPVCVVTCGGVQLPPVECARVVLDDAEVLAELAGLDDTTVTDAERGGPLDVRHPAYVIYTSGSTGRPKGVVVTHSGVASLALAQGERFGIQPASRKLQFASFSFDAAAAEMIVTLANGAALVVAPASRLVAGEPLARLVAEQGVTHVTLPPAVLGVLPDGALPEGVTLVVAGEACAPELVGRWSRGRRMVNAYGPTEATVCATMSAPLSGAVVPPMGGPIANARVYVLDEGLRPVPAGVPGELYLAGAGLARGYLGRPALTAERFVADPFGEPGGRLYRTGDLVRWRADGELEFLGRTDHQVKVRGFRIELGEIESALAGHASVAEALVVVREDGPAGRQLVGYVTPADGCAPDVAELRQHVAASLPDYMVPATVVVLDRWPLTPNGKVDRKRLPVPEFATEGGRAPRTEREETLAAVFADVLGRESVTIDDDFFDLGGDSISSIRLVSQARAAGLTVTAQQVFQHRTVAALAAVAEGSAEPAATGGHDPVGPFPMTPIMHWLRELDGPWEGFNQSVTVRVPAGFDHAALTAAVRQWLDHHPALRLRVGGAPDGGWRPEFTAPGTVTAESVLHRVDVTGLTGERLRAVVAENGEKARLRLAPRDGVVTQLVRYDAGPAEPGLLQVLVHHLAVDAVSWHLLLDDLRAACEAAADGRTARLTQPRTPFREWAHRLAEAAREPRWEDGLPVWTATAPATPEPPLGARPLDPRRDTVGTVRDLTLTLPSERVEPLLTTVPAAFSAGVNDVLVTAFALALDEWRRRRGRPAGDGVLIDLEGHGREDVLPGADVSGTVGWFTSLYPVRLRPGPLEWTRVRSGDTGVGDALKAVKEQLRALPGNGVGYGLLRHLNPRTAPRLAGLPVPDVGFNYLGRMASSGPAATAGVAAAWTRVGGLPTPAPRDAGMPVHHTLEVNAVTEDLPGGPRLSVTWSWPAELLAEADVRELAEAWFEALDGLAAHATGADAGGHTPSDLSLALSQEEIDELEAELRSL